MPVLEKEVSVQPSNLFDSIPEFSSMRCAWDVLHTRPRTEKAVARRLARAGASFFLPLYERRYRRQRRLIRSFLPLFPGYVFTLAGDVEQDSLWQTSQVVRRLPVSDQQRLHADLHRIYQMIVSQVPLAPEERIEPGMPAEIVSGPMKGYRGTVIRRGSALRFVIAVDFLQRGASVEIASSDVRPL